MAEDEEINMKHTYLHDVLPFLRELEREKQKQF